MASQRSMPRSLANMASSFTRAMLTCRKVFSSSLVSSASFVPDTAAVRGRGGGGGRGRVEPRAPRGGGGGAGGAGGRRRGPRRSGQLPEEGWGRGKALDPPLVGVEPHHVVAHLDRPDGERQPDIPLT